MELVLILAEKPSQAKAYAAAFKSVSRKDGYFEVKDNRFFNGDAYITWGIGHLVEMVAPPVYKEEWKNWDLKYLPIIPEKFKFQVPKDKKKQFNVIKGLLGKVSEVIVATDSDREGENIARSIIEHAGFGSVPTKRLWINSLEVDEIQKGFKNLRNGNDYFPLYEEAQSRQFGDWLVGMNASRLYTLLLQQKGLEGAFSVGRVQTPTLYLIYRRQQEIQKFKAKPFYEIFADVLVSNGKFNAKIKDRFETEEQAKELITATDAVLGCNKDGIISSVEKQKKKKNAPKLHSLSTLQSKANKLWKYSPSDVLKIVQDLYEKKIVSYPRTDTQFITESEFNYLKTNLDKYKETVGIDFETVYSNPRKSHVDGSKVQEHYAIIPTKQAVDLNTLPEKEKNVYKEILLTTLAMFAPDYVYEETNIEVDLDGLVFEKKGKVEIQKGWETLFDGYKNLEKKKDAENEVLPAVRVGESADLDISLKDGMTSAPKPFTEGQIIQVMKTAGKDLEDKKEQEVLKETQGIGTEATRASVIETLKKQKYIEVKKNVANVTSKGEILCQAVNGSLLASAEMTAKWETYLARIGKREGTQEKFLESIEKFVRSLLNDAGTAVSKLEGNINEVQEQASIGTCPVCKKGRINDKGKFYGCSGYCDGCRFSLPKNFVGKSISVTNIKKILSEGKTNLIKGFVSKKKKGSKFDAYLKLKEDGKIEFVFPNK